MFILERKNGPFNPSPREFKNEEEAMEIFSMLKGKGAPAQLYKKVGKKVELIATCGGP